MKTLIDMDEELLKKVMEMSEAKTKKEAVHTAMRQYVRSQELRRFAQRLRAGEIEYDMTLEELERLREED